MDDGAATERNIHIAFDDIGAGDPAGVLGLPRSKDDP